MSEIRFYLDESVDVTIANGLIRRDVEVLTAKDAGNLGLSDKEQLDYARKNNFVIVTHDADFLSLALVSEHKGIAYSHQQKYSTGDLIRRLKLLWEVAGQKDMINHVEFL